MMGTVLKFKFSQKIIQTIKGKSKHGHLKKTKDLLTYTINIQKNGTLLLNWWAIETKTNVSIDSEEYLDWVVSRKYGVQEKIKLS